MNPDPKPGPRIRDPGLLRTLHLRWHSCHLCGSTGHPIGGLSLHHIHKHPRDDVEANLMMLCGSGTTGCHGDIEARVPAAMIRLARYLVARDDFLAYLIVKLNGERAAYEWFDALTTTKLTT